MMLREMEESIIGKCRVEQGKLGNQKSWRFATRKVQARRVTRDTETEAAIQNSLLQTTTFTMTGKRRHQPVESDDDDDNSQASSPKRPRLNGTTQGANDGEIEELDGGYTYQYHSHVDEDQTLHLDVSSDEGGEDPANELRATQMVQRHYQENKDNVPSEQGIIEEVYMVNFMCHGKLRIALGPLINFIIGHNGSGKSAILTALTICLGVKAAQTNRAGNLKNFIKTGEESAYVSVKIKNQGDMAYKPADYGKSIIVERHFSKTTSGFKIKNAEGKTMSTKRAELENIVDFFALQLDNPMNVLSQDNARQFLSNSSPYDKYKFFIKGTQLEQLDGDYRMLEESLDNIESHCEVRESDIEHLGVKARQAEEKKKLIDRSQTISEKINQLRWQHAWAQVEEQERELERFEAEVQRAENKMRVQQGKADEASKLYDESNTTRQANAEVITDLEEQLVPLQNNLNEIKQVFDSNVNDMRNKKAEQRSIKEDINGYKRTKQDLQAKIDAERIRIENANGPAHAQKISDLEDARVQLQESRQREEQHTSQKAHLNTEANEAKNEANSARSSGLQRKKQAVEDARNMIQRVEADQGKQAEAFPSQIHNVIRQIKNTRGWTEEPIGPMGMHVRILKPEWASIIETVCGGQLDGFVVKNNHDRGLLSKILRQQNWYLSSTMSLYAKLIRYSNSPILVNNGQHIDTSRHEPAQHVDTILRVLEVSRHCNDSFL